MGRQWFIELVSACALSSKIAQPLSFFTNPMVARDFLVAMSALSSYSGDPLVVVHHPQLQFVIYGRMATIGRSLYFSYGGVNDAWVAGYSLRSTSNELLKLPNLNQILLLFDRVFRASQLWASFVYFHFC
ncbi:uncharacterized protein LOC110620141 [Manihot esculenta]|uniref:uncharacterized protein LOC110620141 n=1 Tax=Manihot esculenta TaxID=3983 RepID=UPI000B5D29CB|nr:uncharacterized protein LOC110620141 [Manihot esculenta]